MADSISNQKESSAMHGEMLILTGKGFRVLRFNNHDVMSNRQGVLETIAAAIEHAPSLSLPRKRGRGPTERVA
jgi:very-short-patch-repair endonuclease